MRDCKTDIHPNIQTFVFIILLRFFMKYNCSTDNKCLPIVAQIYKNNNFKNQTLLRFSKKYKKVKKFYCYTNFVNMNTQEKQLLKFSGIGKYKKINNKHKALWGVIIG